MAEDWELKSLERRMDSLEERWKQAEEKRRDAEVERRRRRDWWVEHLWWTALVALLTTYVVLSATGKLHHH